MNIRTKEQSFGDWWEWPNGTPQIPKNLYTDYIEVKPVLTLDDQILFEDFVVFLKKNEGKAFKDSNQFVFWFDISEKEDQVTFSQKRTIDPGGYYFKIGSGTTILGKDKFFRILRAEVTNTSGIDNMPMISFQDFNLEFIDNDRFDYTKQGEVH